MKKALVHMHSVYTSTAQLLSFAWAAGLFGFVLRFTVELEKPEMATEERGLVAQTSEMVKI